MHWVSFCLVEMAVIETASEYLLRTTFYGCS